MGEGLKRAVAAAKATRKPLVDVRVGDLMKDNEPWKRGCIVRITALVEDRVLCRDVKTGADRNIRIDRVWPIGADRYSGFTLLPRDAAAEQKGLG